MSVRVHVVAIGAASAIFASLLHKTGSSVPEHYYLMFLGFLLIVVLVATIGDVLQRSSSAPPTDASKSRSVDALEFASKIHPVFSAVAADEANRPANIDTVDGAAQQGALRELETEGSAREHHARARESR